MTLHLDQRMLQTAPPPRVHPPISRLLGRRDGEHAGPTLVVCAGIHGNEPAGIVACRAVLEKLDQREVEVRGSFLCLAGNLEALRRGKRYLEQDLNRVWTGPKLRALDADPTLRTRAEGREQWELARLFDVVIGEARGPLVFLDLHSCSASGAPFAILGDTLRNRRVAFPLGVPVILGLEETLDGTLLDWLVEQGHVALAVEGGQHDSPETAERLEALLWLALVASGCVEEEAIQEPVDAARRLLRGCTQNLPRIVEVIERKALENGDGFQMRPGYVNFQRVRRGEVLADDGSGEIRCPLDAHLLMPLYQDQGDDGFFLARPVRRFWLTLSAWCRRAHLSELLVPLLPGVRPHPTRPHTLVADPRIARWLVVEVFRLLGYRRRDMENGMHVFSRRRP